MSSTPYISVIIVSWNALDTVKKCLPSVVETDHTSFEIIFVDNASSDDSVQWVQSEYPAVRIVRHPENWAFCRGNNEAVPHAKGEVLVFLNNDVEVPKNWLKPISDQFQLDPMIGAAQPKIMQFDRRDWFEYAGAAGGFIDRDGFPFARGRLFGTLEQDFGQYDQNPDIFWASGTCLAIRKQLFTDLGGFETSFFMHMEEIDLCWRIKALGYRIVLIPTSRVFHIGGASLAAQSPQKHFLNFRNNLVMLYRNLPPKEWEAVYFRRKMLDTLAIVKMGLSLNFKGAKAVLRAHQEAKTIIKALGKGSDRSNQHHLDPVAGNTSGTKRWVPVPFTGSIVWNYYVRRRTRFSDLPIEKFSPRA